MKKLVILLPLLIAACGGDVKGELGLRKEGPDEFAVERKPKLEVPPSFSLRVPAPGEAPINAKSPTDAAREALVNSSVKSDAPKTEAESNFLQKAGANDADAQIKAVLHQEYNQEKDQDIIDKLDSLSEDNFEKTVVDPEKEKERILNNKKDNKPITEGETPAKSINDDKSLLDKVL